MTDDRRLRPLARRLDDPSRRRFLADAARGLLGVAVAPFVAPFARAASAVPLAPATARHVIYVYLSGGMSQLDTFDPKPGAETQGPTRSIDTAADGVRISEHFPLLARRMDKVAVVRSMQSTQGAHAQGRYHLHTGYELRGTIRHPSLGAWLERLAGTLHPELPAHVSVGGGAYTASAGFLDPRFTPLPLGDPEEGLPHAHRPAHVPAETFDRRLARLDAMNTAFRQRHPSRDVDAYADLYEQAVKLMDSADLAAFDLSRESAATRAAYGEDRLGQGCLLARRLVEHGVRFVEVVNGGWDTHNDNFETMEELCPPLDRALAALLADLDARGLLDETLVVLATEFGRTPRIVEKRNGRNHHPQAFTCLLAGGGVVGGRAWGATNETGEEIVTEPVRVKDFNATIAYALGLPLDHELVSPSGRPFTVADDGKPVTGLFA
ncbi:MAG: DUF1501 domain-containing protein [Planctomycetota bacterium JB042]